MYKQTYTYTISHLCISIRTKSYTEMDTQRYTHTDTPLHTYIHTDTQPNM